MFSPGRGRPRIKPESGVDAMPSKPQETWVKISSARDFPSLLEERVAEFRLNFEATVNGCTLSDCWGEMLSPDLSLRPQMTVQNKPIRKES